MLFRKRDNSDLTLIKEEILRKREAQRVKRETPQGKVMYMVTYSLEGKNSSQKVQFNYKLTGRKGQEGLLQELGGEKISSGCFLVPVDRFEEMEKLLKEEKVKFNKRKIALLED